MVEGCTDIQITMSDSTKLQGRVHGIDRRSDIAVVKITSNSNTDLPIATLGASGKLRPGEFVVAVGSPLMLQVGCHYCIQSKELCICI